MLVLALLSYFRRALLTFCMKDSKNWTLLSFGVSKKESYQNKTRTFTFQLGYLRQAS